VTLSTSIRYIAFRPLLYLFTAFEGKQNLTLAIMRSLQATTLLALAPLAISTSSTKRGLCHVPSQKHPTDDNIWTTVPGSDLTWYYNYQPTASQAFESDNSLEFIPMLWGASDNDVGTPFLDAVKSRISSGKNVTYVLGFNEPDGSSSTGGSGIPVDLAASTWIKQIEPLKKMGVKLGAPAVTGSPNGFVWLKNFFQQCNGSCNPDFIPVHWYGNFEGMASHIGEVIGTFPNISKVWVTEWGFPNQPLAATQSFYNMSTEYFDRME
jgi:hypothetical protein